ncbi:acyltransferase family protein [Flavobacterium subsaxonicum]|uniref:Acyltransferase n=1 Tax=Flavobacterium subsaxonicum WB 4.1-42 = DSM 21790 TaxID=1121898 RepID=A0A0A2MHG7_9FLAO|nr:acyltransferase [Flavobacterium subsaxonicum]KGO91709.1 acyltransferase [Flavobacterium subsaxonicum WB 4.1-42 = DSM 21790]
MSTVAVNSKPHYLILDGLRGVAAIMVVVFHIFEAHANSHLDQIINHGYLAVDFFFLLSGFVIGYAYDDRWHKLTLKEFFKRRLIRLQPMVIMGMIIGAVCFYYQDSVLWPQISDVPVWKMLLVMVIGFTLIPLTPSQEIRGWGEMHPLNGPGWSLFFEYIANIMYALFVRKFSKTVLAILVILSGAALVHLALTAPAGDVVGGWSINAEQLKVGFSRMMFPFFGGLLLSRMAKITYIKNAFLWCSLLLIVVLAMPRIGGADNLWLNGIYESVTIICIFPLIVYLGASGTVHGAASTKVCKFFGDISYPIYITHYPLIYIYTAWVANNKVSIQDGAPYAILLLVSAIVIAYACLKLYDEPVRKWLGKKFPNKNKVTV